jgi:CHRD domain
MRARPAAMVLAALAVAFFLVAPTMADDEAGRFRARLTGYEEVPAVSTVANGTFRASLGEGPTIDYELTYSDIQGAFAAHIHFAQSGVNGGIVAFLCGGGDKPPCPPTGGTVTGTIDRADVTGPAGQGIAAGEIEEAIAAMRAGVTYANVHTTDNNPATGPGPGDFGGGEIRGQIRRGS